jgi:hypothetical protein
MSRYVLRCGLAMLSGSRSCASAWRICPGPREYGTVEFQNFPTALRADFRLRR